MSLLETYKKNQQEQAQRAQEAKEQQLKELADDIRARYEKNKEQLVPLLEEELVKDGRVYLTGFGCLCQSGVCSWQEGYQKFLTDITEEWAKKGVSVTWNHMTGIMFALPTFHYGYSIATVNVDTLEKGRD